MKKLATILFIVLLALLCSQNSINADEMVKKHSEEETEIINNEYVEDNGVRIAAIEEDYIDPKWAAKIESNKESNSIKSIVYKNLSITKYYQDYYSDIMQTCGYTIASKGCALTSVTMAYNYLANDNKNPSQINTILGNDACEMQWSNAATKLGLTEALHISNPSGLSWTTIDTNLYTFITNDTPVIVLLKNGEDPHYVLVKGINVQSSSVTYYINDPLHGNNYSTLSQYTNNGWTINQMIAFSD